MGEGSTFWVMRTCPICGKEFLPAAQHSWKIGNHEWRKELVCSYTCMRKWEKDPKIYKIRRKKVLNDVN